MSEVSRVQTKYSQTEVAQFLVSALTSALGSEPNQAMSEMLLADLAMECGFNGKSGNFDYVWNNNFGNVTITSESQDYWTTKTHKFRSYSTPEAGMKNYVHEILRRKTLKQAALEGDVINFTYQLRDTKYCPDCDPDKITPTLSSFIRGYQAAHLFDNLPSAPPKSLSSSSHVLTWAILGMGGYIFYRTINLKPGRKRAIA
jgi:hypothetical protein